MLRKTYFYGWKMTVNTKVHVFTDVPVVVFLKQSPVNSSHMRQVNFTFGTTVPDDSDVLICFNRASYTIKTHVPKDRTIFIAAEPDVIHPYSCRYLNQYGLVLTTTKKNTFYRKTASSHMLVLVRRIRLFRKRCTSWI